MLLIILSALVRIRIMLQVPEIGARMCVGSFFTLVTQEKILYDIFAAARSSDNKGNKKVSKERGVL